MRRYSLVVLILVGSAALRVWAIGFALPYVYNADERANLRRVESILKDADPNPHFFHYPSLLFYVNVLPHLLLDKYGSGQSATERGKRGVRNSFGLGNTRLPDSSKLLMGRFVSLAFGVGCVGIAFLAALRVTRSRPTAAVSAALLAVSPIHVGQSRLMTVDILVSFFALLTLFASIKVFEKGRTWDYAFAGIAAGLAVGSKYSGAVVLVIPAAAHFLRTGLINGFRQKRIYLVPLIALGAFLFTTPFAVLDSKAFLRDLNFVANHYESGHLGMEGEAPLFYLRLLTLVEGPITIIGLLTFLAGVLKRNRLIILLGSFPATYFSFIAIQQVRNERTLLPLLPFMAILGSIGIVWLGRSLRLKRRRTIALAVASSLTFVSLAFAACTSFIGGVRFSGPEVRSETRAWIYQNIPRGSSIGVGTYTTWLDESKYTVRRLGHGYAHPPSWYRQKGLEILVLGESGYGRIYDYPENNVEEIEQYEEILRAFPIIKKFRAPPRLETLSFFDDPDYEILILQVK